MNTVQYFANNEILDNIMDNTRYFANVRVFNSLASFLKGGSWFGYINAAVGNQRNRTDDDAPTWDTVKKLYEGIVGGGSTGGVWYEGDYDPQPTCEQLCDSSWLNINFQYKR